MDLAELAALLAGASDTELDTLVSNYRDQLGADLARELKQLYDASEASDPQVADGAARALDAVAGAVSDETTQAMALWVSGMAALDSGQMERAIGQLDSAEATFLGLNDEHAAASTQVSKLIALAILGRYDEAEATGISARDLFVASGDDLAAGKIEQNLGNIAGRRDRHAEAEVWFRSARERFLAVGDQKQLAQIDNCLATALKWQHQFRDAALLYQQAMARAEAEGQTYTLAEIEDNYGLLAFFQGQYDVALDYLERSRQRFADLGLPHETAYSELELAEVYLDLGLLPEVVEMTSRALPVFEEHGMRAELARGWLVRARALRAQEQLDEALAGLDIAAELFLEEGNTLGGAMVTLARAELLLHTEDVESAASAALEAEQAFQGSGVAGRLLLARWMHGEALREAGLLVEARERLESTLADAQVAMLPELTYRAETSLGLVATASGEIEEAEEHFLRAIDQIETLREPLPVEDFRAAFLSIRLRPYSEMVRVCLASGTGERTVEALEFVERARSRVLVDELSRGLERGGSDDPLQRDVRQRLEELRQELNWFYSQINRVPDGDSLRGPGSVEALQAEARDRERAILDLQRQAGQRSLPARSKHSTFDVVRRLQAALDDNTTVVEYFSLDDEFLAFVITRADVRVVRQLGTVDEVADLVRGLRFQLDTLRYGQARIQSHMAQLVTRVQRGLNSLHDLVFQPVEPWIGGERLVVIPHRTMHYVPFQALFNDGQYLVERFEISYAPGTAVLLHCLERPEREHASVLAMGVPDERIPRVREEVASVVAQFNRAEQRDGEAATIGALRELAPAADVIHLACHGYFRPDNPLFSSLQLGDGWLTVREAGELRLDCSLVTLSACETGISEVAPGDELVGIARGFMSAGAPSVLVSLWTVDDESTARLMEVFYRELVGGAQPAQALRLAQLALLRTHPHPFYWSPFALIGRW